MLSFRFVVFASLCTLAICETQGVYNLQQVQHQSPGYPKAANYYEQLQSNGIAQPRYGLETALWNPFTFINFETFIQPAIQILGFIAGLLGVFQVSDWLLGFAGLAPSKSQGSKDKTEETNEVDRRKRMISAEETARVLGSIEAVEKALEKHPQA